MEFDKSFRGEFQIEVVSSVSVACIQNLSYNRRQTVKNECYVLRTEKHNPAAGEGLQAGWCRCA